MSEGHTSGWKGFWDLNPEWSGPKGQQTMPCLCVLCPGILLTTEQKFGKTSVRVMFRWSPFTGSLNKSVHYGLPWIARETCVNLCTAYLPSCRIMGFPTPALSQITWLKFWCGQQKMELLNPREGVYQQGAMVARRGHMNWCTSSFLIWVSAANLQMRHA